MKSKWTLFTGILLLTVGIVLKNVTDFSLMPILLIIIGVLFKAYYIISKVRSGEYIPGYELILFFIGLFLFLSGLYLRSHDPSVWASLFIIFGITLKVTFIFLFILKVRSSGKTSFKY